jgi:hypothetical protein
VTPLSGRGRRAPEHRPERPGEATSSIGIAAADVQDAWAANNGLNGTIDAVIDPDLPSGPLAVETEADVLFSLRWMARLVSGSHGRRKEEHARTRQSLNDPR